jgi:hypothetical protein
MSRVKFLQATGFFVAGVAVAALIFPAAVSGAVAALTFTGIQGATGGTRANVTNAGQLQVTTAGVSQIFVRTTHGSLNEVPALVLPPLGDALVITSIEIWPTVSDCDLTISATVQGVNTRIATEATCTSGPTVLPYNPGLLIAPGHSLDVFGAVSVTVVGYTIPNSAV